jgi:drug/metabolite transporter (DMT)-like permease
MVYLALAVVCSLVIGVIFKLARRVGIDRLGLLTVNYFVAMLLALCIGPEVALDGRASDITLLISVGLANGVLFVVGFGLYAAAIERVGLALSAATMRIAVLIPFVASWVIWHELPTTLQLPGMVVAVGAFGLMALPLADQNRRTVAEHPAALLALLFLVAGITDTTLKVYDEHLADFASRSTYLFVAFAGAFVSGVLYLVGSRRRLSSALSVRTLAGGLALGLLNYGSVEFFLQALAELPGTLVFPVNHVAVLVGGTLLGVLIWKEVLSRSNWLGLALACLALALLTW